MENKRKKAAGESDGEMHQAENERRLLRMLLAQADLRGDSYTTLSKRLGVTYRRLLQWRRGEGDMANANAAVHRRAAAYLGIPNILELVVSGKINLADLAWPSQDALNFRVTQKLRDIAQDPFMGPFMPNEIFSASPGVRLFVAFLYHELVGNKGAEPLGHGWLRALHLSALQDEGARDELQRLRARTQESAALF